MSVGLYFIMMLMMPPEAKEMPGGQAAVAKALADLGPMTASEKRLLAVSLISAVLLGDGRNSAFLRQPTTTTVAVALLFLPGIGVMDWKRANTLIPWGTVVLFGVGIGLGTALAADASSAMAGRL